VDAWRTSQIPFWLSDILGVMIAAVCVAIIIMLAASGPLPRFIERHPTTKMLALAFLLMIGIALVADGMEFHIPRGYLYFAIAFSVGVETLNLLLRRRRPP
jgi:predicted tellurium resistance membrane protein TerC